MPVLPSYRKQSIALEANQLTGFYMRATLASFNRLMLLKRNLQNFICQHKKTNYHYQQNNNNNDNIDS